MLAIVSVRQNEWSISGYFPGRHDVRDKWTSVELGIEYFTHRSRGDDEIAVPPVPTTAPRYFRTAARFRGALRARFPPGANQEVPSLCCLDTFHCNIVAECPTQGLRKDGIPGLIPQGLAALTTFDPEA
jgi:hypothetical protein